MDTRRIPGSAAVAPVDSSVVLVDAQAVLVYEHALETFGSSEAAGEWMNQVCHVLGAKPANLMADEPGRRKVENVLGCIDHGLIY